MPPQGYERPAQAGGPPRAGFAMRRMPAQEPGTGRPNDGGRRGIPANGAGQAAQRPGSGFTRNGNQAGPGQAGPPPRPGQPGPPPRGASPVSARIEQLLVAAQRQIAEHARAIAEEAARAAAKIKAAA